MFTGLIEDMGTVTALQRVPQGLRLTIRTRFDDLQNGESMAVNGVCLTAVGPVPNQFTADVSAETLSRTTLGTLEQGDKVNLERPMALGERLGGHLVLGHVDAVGEVVSKTPVGEGVRVELRLPKSIQKYVVEKGSIAIDGISLTVNEVHDPDRIALFLIPETLRATKPMGPKVNLEVDILAKHIERLLQFKGA